NIQMQEKDIHELINDYLFDRLQPVELDKLNYLRSTNPEIDFRVRQNEEAFRILKYMRYKEIRQLLFQVDATEPKSYKKKFYKAWVVVILFLFSLIGVWSWMAEHFSPLSIVMRNYESVAAASLFHGEESKVSLHNWELANMAFNKREFEAAILQYESFSGNPDTVIANNARWNILLARFALAGPVPNWREEIKIFISDPPEPFKGKAESLLHMIDSDFYKIIIIGVPEKMSTFKPRLL